MPDPPFVHRKTVDKIHNGQNRKQLPKSRRIAACAVYRIDAQEDIKNISRDADELEFNIIPPDFFWRYQPDRNTPLLHLFVLEIHQTNRAFLRWRRQK